MVYTYHQEMILAVVPKVTSSFGIPCELFLLYQVYRDQLKGRANPMLRALFGVSFFGLIDAFAWFLSSWPVPVGSFALSAGNQATCNFQGFLLQSVIGAPFYSCALAFYFYEVIVNDRPLEEIIKKERYIHIGIISYSLFTSVLLLSLGQYNPIGNICWTTGLPSGCGNSVFITEPGAPDCERGDWAWAICMATFYIPLWCCIVFIFYFNFAIWINLRHTTDGQWYAAQSTLYALAFCVTWAPSTTFSVASYSGIGGFGLEFCSAFFEPLAGVWNLYIFLRNRQSIRKKIQQFFCCQFDRWNDQNSESDDIEGAPRRKSRVNTSNVDTVEHLETSTSEMRHSKSRNNNELSETSLSESEYKRKEKKRMKKERKLREAEAASVAETKMKTLEDWHNKSALERVLIKRKHEINYSGDYNKGTSSISSTAPINVGTGNTMVDINSETNDGCYELKSVDTSYSDESRAALDARLEI